MSLRDDLIPTYASLCALVSSEEVERIKKELATGTNPRDLKMSLARKIVALYHGEKKALASEKNFKDVFQNKKEPEDTLVVKVKPQTLLRDVCLSGNIISSKSEWHRLVTQGAVITISGTKIHDPNFSLSRNETFRIGKKRFLKIELF